jgi:hypothetical protein
MILPWISENRDLCSNIPGALGAILNCKYLLIFPKIMLKVEPNKKTQNVNCENK